MSEQTVMASTTNVGKSLDRLAKTNEFLAVFEAYGCLQADSEDIVKV